jgi:hypothetical protein
MEQATDYLIRLLKIHEKYDENGLAQLPSEIIDLAKGYVDGLIILPNRIQLK